MSEQCPNSLRQPWKEADKKIAFLHYRDYTQNSQRALYSWLLVYYDESTLKFALMQAYYGICNVWGEERYLNEKWSVPRCLGEKTRTAPKPSMSVQMTYLVTWSHTLPHKKRQSASKLPVDKQHDMIVVDTTVEGVFLKRSSVPSLHRSSFSLLYCLRPLLFL